MAQTAPLLDLDTLSTKRPSIRIDGKSYELRNIDEFSFLKASQDAARFQRLRQMMSAKRPSKRTGADISRMLEEFCQLIVLAPPAVHAKLKDTHRAEIALAFFHHQQSLKTAAAKKARLAGTRNRGRQTTSKSGPSSARG